MSTEHLRPGQHAHRQVPALARYVHEEVYPYSRLYRQRIDRAGLVGGLRSPRDLPRLPAVTYEDIGDGSSALLAPAADTIRSYAPRPLRLRFALADALGRRAQFARDHIEPDYKPILWISQDRLDIGATAADLDLLADIGRRTLERAGVRGSDQVVTLSEPTPDLGYWQLVLGCRAGGVAAMHLGAGARRELVADAGPTVLAGHPVALLALARQARAGFDGVRTVIAIGAPISAAERARLTKLGHDGGHDAVVVSAWAPDGVRALWAECREGQHLHTWPDAEIIEIVDAAGTPVADDAGEVTWSALGWRGTALLRLRTGVVGRLVGGACPACGRTTPRLEIDQ
jgi:phenylacetate-coenzyme A ligase PaaK-like adenylate-forming protein